ncbi:MAG TPA: M36 family metallopeptidase, partial [Pyrinomonadaceae bacterium]
MSKARKSLLVVSIFALLSTVAFLSLRSAPTNAQKKAGLSRPTGSHDDGLENYDIRTDKNAGESIATFRGRAQRPAESITAVRDRQESGIETLRRRTPSLKVDYSETLRVPEVIGPDVRDGKVFLTKPTIASRSEALKSFIASNANVVGLDPSEVASLKTVADYADPNGKLAFVELEQDINGIPVFQGSVKAGFTKNGEMIRVVNTLAPGVLGGVVSTDFADPISAANAAASHINVDPGTLKLALNDAASTDQKQVFGQGSFATTAEKMYFPTEPGVVVPAWRVMIWQNGRAFYVIVDAATGTLLWRKNLTEDQAQSASYMVYVNSTNMTAASNSLINAPDSPYPLTPGVLDPSVGTQGSGISRSLVTLIGNESPNTFNQLGWITDGGNTTAGNNVIAGLDRKLPNDNGPAGDIDPDGIATGTSRVFNFALNAANPSTGAGDSPLPTGQSPGTCLAQSDTSTPSAYQQAITTQLFYLVNRYHDVMYQFGFNEAARNFQNTNFTGQGLGGDRVSAQAQDCSGTNNANFTTPSDGAQPTMQMYLWPSTTGRAMIDGSLDADVVLHEHTHGLSNRLHGNSSGLTTNMARGMGEGISDFYSRSLLAEPTDLVQGIYTTGAYATSNGFADRSVTGNTYYGIRRYPYDVMSHTGGINNKPHNAFTFSYLNSNCNSRLNNSNFAFARNPVFGGSTCDEVHNIGEIWATMLWECRGKFITRLGAVAGNQRILQIVTDGMKLAPAGPTFLTERDAIIAAAVAGGDPSDVADLWAGFSIRGLGASASITTTGTGANNAQVTDGFDLPNLTQTQNLTVSDLTGDADGFAEPGETINVTIPITNNTGQIATNVNVSIVGGGTVNYGTLTGAQTLTKTVPFTVPANATCGAPLSITINVTSSLGSVSFTRQIFVGKPATTAATQNFDGVTAPSLPLGWTVATEQGGSAFVNSTLSADSAPNSMYAVDPTTVGGATDLISPKVSVTSSTATVTFRQSFSTEFASGTVWDGGVLEISIDNGAFQDILVAGGSFTQNGYNTVLGGGNNNPIASRAAWGNTSGGFITTVAQLPASANGK